MVLESLRHLFIHNYLENKELNHFYVSIILVNFGVSLISLFVPIYLYSLGYPIYKILFFFFIWSFSYLIFLYPGTRIISRVGVKHAMLISNVFIILYYIGLNFIGIFSFLFFILPAIKAVNTVFYWNAYHALFIMKADKKKRSRELSFTHIITYSSIAIAPFIGGLIAKETFTLLFIIGSLFVLSSTVPLFLTKEKYCPHHFTIKSLFRDFLSKKEKKDVLSFSAYAVDATVQTFIWPIFLIIILGTYVKTGLIVSLTTALSLVGLYVAGIVSDKYNKIKLIKIWTILHSIGWFMRIFANSFFKIFFIDSYKLITNKFLQIPWDSQICDLADKRDYFRFIVFRHFVYHTIRIAIIPVLMLIFYLNFYPFTLSFIIAGIFSLFYMFINKK